MTGLRLIEPNLCIERGVEREREKEKREREREGEREGKRERKRKREPKCTVLYQSSKYCKEMF